MSEKGSLQNKKQNKKAGESLSESGLTGPTHGVLKGEPVGKDQCPLIRADLEQS